MWEQANGVSQSVLENPTTSPLPLIAPPGIIGTLAKTSSGFPAGITQQCVGNRAAAFSPSGALGDRLNPTVTPYDVAVPGSTVHEVIAMFQPLSSCVSAPNQAQLAQTPFGLALLSLNQIVRNESEGFYPVLANFGTQETQLQAAVSLHGQLATVWVGSNDLIHFAFANGASPVAGSASIGTDITTIIRQLQGSGAKVAVANMVDILGTAAFYPVQSTTEPTYEQNLAAFVQAAIVNQAAAQLHVSPAMAAQNPQVQQQVAQAAQVAHQYAQAEIAQAGLGPNGYFLLPELLSTVAAILQKQPVPSLTPGGAGEYLSDGVAAQLKTLNVGYNQAITSAAQATGAALADVAAIITQGEALRASGKPFPLDAQGDVASLNYGGGFFTLDGVHPSNAGYALVANAFIAAFGKQYGLTIPAVDVHSIYVNDPYSAANFSTINPAGYLRAAP